MPAQFVPSSTSLAHFFISEYVFLEYPEGYQMNQPYKVESILLEGKTGV